MDAFIEGVSAERIDAVRQIYSLCLEHLSGSGADAVVDVRIRSAASNAVKLFKRLIGARDYIAYSFSLPASAQDEQ